MEGVLLPFLGGFGMRLQSRAFSTRLYGKEHERVQASSQLFGTERKARNMLERSRPRNMKACKSLLFQVVKEG